MSNETTENFWKAFNSWNPEPPKPPSFRLYYNELGDPIVYTMEELQGQYIEVDRETYLNSLMNVKVRDGKLIIIPRSTQVRKLKPNQSTGTDCDARDICVVSSGSNTVKWGFAQSA
jgi:hypothetical protein